MSPSGPSLRLSVCLHRDDDTLVFGSNVGAHVYGDPASPCGGPRAPDGGLWWTVKVDPLFELARVSVQYEIPVESHASVVVDRKCIDKPHSGLPFSRSELVLRNAEDLGKGRQAIVRDRAFPGHPARDGARVDTHFFRQPALRFPSLSQDASERRLGSHERLRDERSAPLARSMQMASHREKGGRMRYRTAVTTERFLTGCVESYRPLVGSLMGLA
jgi:hypothetical protein